MGVTWLTWIHQDDDFAEADEFEKFAREMKDVFRHDEK